LPLADSPSPLGCHKKIIQVHKNIRLLKREKRYTSIKSNVMAIFHFFALLSNNLTRKWKQEITKSKQKAGVIFPYIDKLTWEGECG
jgi:hypothetical protein